MGRRHILRIFYMPEHYGRSVGQGVRQIWQKASAHLWSYQHNGLLHNMGHVNESYHGHNHKSNHGWW